MLPAADRSARSHTLLAVVSVTLFVCRAPPSNGGMASPFLAAIRLLFSTTFSLKNLSILREPLDSSNLHPLAGSTTRDRALEMLHVVS